MGQCFLYGNGSAGTGLTIVSGLTEPVKPKENMIWVKSDKAGKKYVFAEVFPEAPADGTIVFLSKAKSIAYSAYVFTSGAWESVEASMYIGGKWVTVSSKFDGILYDAGDRYDEWTADASVGAETSRSPTLNAATRASFTRRTKCLLTALPPCI